MSSLKAYGQLMRLHKPIGFLLLLWPTLWALWLAAQGAPSFSVLIIFVLGVFLMRSAGCIINDVADRRIDGRVTRTCQRPLVIGSVCVRDAIILFVILCFLAFCLVLLLNPLAMVLSFGALALAILYPFCKRFLPMPQLVLGLAFAFSIPMVFAQIRGSVPLAAWLLFIATAAWVVAYDTEYALADLSDDLKIGIHSSAIAWGRWVRWGILLCQGLMLALLVCVGLRLHLKVWFGSALVAVSGFFVYQQWLLRAPLCPTRCMKAFVSHQWVGMILFLGISVAP